MADDIIRRLLVKLQLSSKDFDKQLEAIKTKLDKIYADQAEKSKEKQKAAKQTQEDLTKETALAKQVAEQTAKTVTTLKEQAAVNKELLADQLTKVRQDRENLEIRTASYRMLLAEGKISAETLATLQKQLDVERSQLLVREAIVKAAITGTGGIVRSKPTAAALTSARDTGTAATAVGVAGVEAQVAASTKITALTMEQATEKQRELDLAARELAVEEKIIRVLVQKQAVNEADAKVVLRRITEKRQELALEQAQVRLAAARGGGEGFFGRIGEKLKEGLREVTGGGLFGQIAGGAFTGFVGAEIFTGLIEQIHRLGEELFDATGKSQTLRKEFEQLAEAKGFDPTELADKYRKATHGMVADTELFQIATKFMRQNINVSQDQIMKLVGTTLDLARASGRSVPEAMNALQRAASGGRLQILAYATGLSTMDIQMQKLPETVSRSARQTIQFNQILNAEIQALSKLGGPGSIAITLPELYQQITVAQKNFIESIAEGILKTDGMEETIARLSKGLEEWAPKLMEIGRSIGTNLVEAGKWVLDNWGKIKLLFEAIVLLRLGSWGLEVFSIWKTGLTDVLGVLEKVLAKLVAIKAGEWFAGKLGGGIVRGAEEGVAEGAGGAVAGGLLSGVFPFLVANIAAIGGIVASVIAALGLAWMIRERGATIDAERSKRIMENVQRYGSTIAPGGPARTRFGAPEDVGISAEGAKGFDLLTSVQKMLKRRGAAAEDQMPEANIALIKELADLELKINEAKLKQKYADLKDELDQEGALYKMYYTAGLSDYDTYSAQQKDIRQRQHDLEIQQLNEEEKFALATAQKKNQAQVRTIEIQQDYLVRKAAGPEVTMQEREDLLAQAKGLEAAKVPLQNAQVTEEQQQLIHEEFNAKRKTSDEQLSKWEIQNTETTLSGIRSAYNSLEQEILKIQKEGISAQQEALTKNFQEGLISADNYLTQRKLLIEQEKKAAIDAAEAEYEASFKGPQEQSKLLAQTVEAQINYEKELQKVTQDTDKIRLEGTTNTYNRMKELLTIQKDVAAVSRTTEGKAAEVQAQEELITLNEQYLAQLKEQLLTTHEGSDDWYKIEKAIGGATLAQRQLNMELAGMKDAFGPISQLFGAITAQLTHTTGGLGFWLKQMTGILKQMSDFKMTAAQYGGATGMARNLWQSTTALFKRGTSPGDMIRKAPPTITPEQKLGQTTDQITTKLRAMMDGLQQKFANALSAQSDKVVGGLNALGNAAASATTSLQKLAGAGVGKPRAGAAAGGGVMAPGESPLDLLGVLGGGGETPTGEVSPQIAGGIPDVSGLGIAPSMQESVSNSGKALDELAGSAAKAKDHTTSLGEKFGTFAQNLTQWVGAIGGMIQSVVGAQTTAGGVMGGGMSGVALGAQFAAQLGPWGAVIGGVGGALAGAFFGHKNEMAQRMADEFKKRMQGIEDALNAGTVSLGSAVQQLQIERTAVLAEMSGGKKKERAQLQPVLDALNKEISSLQLQQKQILDGLHQQLAILGSPEAFQPFMDQLDQIMQKYQQFASAAEGNATEMANANKYLTLSMQQYLTTLKTQLGQAQETAVQDALHLLDIQQQQLLLDQQHQTSVFDTLTRGTLTRQRTEAMVKGSEIQALNQQYSQQKDQLNQEQALTEYKVDAEKKIFDLATDRIGLETELLHLQEAAYDKNIAQVQALQQTVTQLSNVLSTGLPPGLMGTTGPINLQAIQQLLGIPVTAVAGNTLQETGNAGLDLLNKPTGNIITHPGMPGYFDDTGYHIGQPPPGSTPMRGAPTPATLPTPKPVSPVAGLPVYQHGGIVEKTGPAIVHQGELVVPTSALGSKPVATRNPFAPFFGGLQNVIISKLQDISAAGALDQHSKIYDLAEARIGLEHDLLNAQSMQTKADLYRISQLTALMDRMGSMGGGDNALTSFEAALAKVYEVRGRYGAGNFRREQL